MKYIRVTVHHDLVTSLSLSLSHTHTHTNTLGWDTEIDIQKSIQLVRAQRSGMVQTEVSLSMCVR